MMLPDPQMLAIMALSLALDHREAQIYELKTVGQ